MFKFYFIIFLVIAAVLFFALHYYIFSRVVTGLELSSKSANYIKILFIIGGLSFFIGEFLNRKYNLYPVIFIVYIWLGILSISFSVFILKDIVQLFMPQHSKLLTWISLGLIFLASSCSLFNESRKPVLKEISLEMKKLPTKLSGFTIVQLSDLHIDNFTSTKWLESIVEDTNKLNPDLIVITGDLIDNADCTEKNMCAILKKLKAKYGVYGTTGNHEYYVGISNFLKFAEESGITMLNNESTTIAGSIELAGMEDDDAKRFSGTGPDLKNALAHCDVKKPVVLLYHRPTKFKNAVDMGVDLQLSGHTHAGQIPPMDLIVYLGYKYAFGLHKYRDSYIYTTFGTGIWGPPMRLFSRSEIVKITLTPVVSN